jgi:hypothetical protein
MHSFETFPYATRLTRKGLPRLNNNNRSLPSRFLTIFNLGCGLISSRLGKQHGRMTEKLMNIDDAWDGHMRRAHLDAAQQQPVPASRPHKAPLAHRAMQISIALVCAWSIVETPWELSPADGMTRVIALVLAKCLLLGVGAAAFFAVRYARPFFAFLCAASVFALASALPLEYAVARELFSLSLIECVCKIALVGSYATWYVKGH